MSLHVAISGWLLGPPSGANRRLLALVERAALRLAPGERITVLHAAHFVPPPLRRVAWQPVAIPGRPSLRRVLAERRLLPPILRELGATVLDHGFLPLPRVPIATCLLVHDVRGPCGLSAWPRIVARAVLRASCARATAVIVPSAWTAAQLRRLRVATTPFVVPNGVDLPDARNDGGAPLPGDHLLHVGHLERRKNLEVVVRALAALAPGRRPTLCLAGRDAGAGARLRACAERLGVADAVQFRGEVSESELAALYGSARAVVVPSRHEGFGLCALEGLAHGRPVLASDAGALPEVTGDLGTLLPPDDPTAWAAAISALPPADTLAEAARRARAATFSWDAAADLLVAAWRRAHQSAPRR